MFSKDVTIIDDLSTSRITNYIPPGVKFCQEPIEIVSYDHFKNVDVVFHLAYVSREARRAYTKSDRAKKILGFTEKTSLPDGLEKTIAWAKEQPAMDFDFGNVDLEFNFDQLPTPWKQ